MTDARDLPRVMRAAALAALDSGEWTASECLDAWISGNLTDPDDPDSGMLIAQCGDIHWLRDDRSPTEAQMKAHAAHIVASQPRAVLALLAEHESLIHDISTTQAAASDAYTELAQVIAERDRLRALVAEAVEQLDRFGAMTIDSGVTKVWKRKAQAAIAAMPAEQETDDAK